MAQLKYVDWDGLEYYDDKIKEYIGNLAEDFIKMGGPIKYSELPSPSFENLNYIYQVTEDFTSNEWFEKPGYIYKAGTWIQVSDLNNIYLYTIFQEVNSDTPLTPDGDIDLSGYYTKPEVDNLITPLKTDLENKADKEDLVGLATKTYVDEALKNVTFDTSTLATKEELATLANNIPSIEGLATEEFVTDAIKAIDLTQYATSSDLEAVKVKIDEVEENLEKLDSNVTTLTTDFNSVKEEVDTLQSQINDKANINDIPSLDGYATEQFVEDIIKAIPATDLSGYALKSDIPSIEGLATETYVDEAKSEFVEEIAKLNEAVANINVGVKTISVDGKEVPVDENGNVEITIPEYTEYDDTKLTERVNEVETALDNKAGKDELHEHDNKDVLDVITVEKVAEWDAKATEAFVTNKIAEAQLGESDVDLTGYVDKDTFDTTLKDYSTTADTETMVDEKISIIDIGVKTVSVGGVNISIDKNGNADIPATEPYDDTQLKKDLESKQDLLVGTVGQYVGFDAEGKAVPVEAPVVDIPEVPTKVSELENDKGYLSAIPEEYVTDEELNAKGYLTEHQDLSDYALKSELPSTEGLASEEFVTQAIESVKVPTKVSELENDSNYLTEVPAEYVTDNELEAKGYLTEHQSLEDYALKTDIPTVPTKVSELENDSGYLTEHQDLSAYALKSEVPSLNGYATEEYVDSKLEDIPGTDLSGLVTTTQLAEALATKANDIPFINAQLVGKAIGGFAAGDSLMNMTLTEILTKLFELTKEEASGVVETILTNRLSAQSGSVSSGLSSDPWVELDLATASYTDTGFYNTGTNAGYQIHFIGNYDLNAQLFAIPADAKITKAYKYDLGGFNQWLPVSDWTQEWVESGITTVEVDGQTFTYIIYEYNVGFMGDALVADEYWRFEIEV